MVVVAAARWRGRGRGRPAVPLLLAGLRRRPTAPVLLAAGFLQRRPARIVAVRGRGQRAELPAVVAGLVQPQLLGPRTVGPVDVTGGLCEKRRPPRRRRRLPGRAVRVCHTPARGLGAPGPAPLQQKVRASHRPWQHPRLRPGHRRRRRGSTSSRFALQQLAGRWRGRGGRTQAKQRTLASAGRRGPGLPAALAAHMGQGRGRRV